ncbi:hypothetical protein [Streptomyces poriferorum]|uniref:Integral membrane protein n=1 Tax=Streptomyces poriferorum TaxID=2798799 RepID=A0ABY9J2U7_9ACTN|nr:MULTISPECIES: hypothetical protein [unclassified Streptomyces]MDP5317397.1 hypothetical protein [Streptomyces sp. Alt4]WLQ62003.1 hypothetical protein P8A19_41755 [Streptomyces sp. Alt2]
MTLLTAFHGIATGPAVHLWADASPAPIVPGYTPGLPAEVNGSVSTILSWTAGGGMAAAVIGGLVGWLLIAVGHNSERAQLAARGKQSVLWSLAGAGGIGITSSLVLAVYNMTVA